MKCVWGFMLAIVAMAILEFVAAAPQANSTRKLKITENTTPLVGSVAFDEIVVESHLNVVGKNPNFRTQRTQLFPVKQNNTNAATNVKLAKP